MLKGLLLWLDVYLALVVLGVVVLCNQCYVLLGALGRERARLLDDNVQLADVLPRGRIQLERLLLVHFDLGGLRGFLLLQLLGVDGDLLLLLDFGHFGQGWVGYGAYALPGDGTVQVTVVNGVFHVGGA